jgi:hypothetical protein
MAGIVNGFPFLVVSKAYIIKQVVIDILFNEAYKNISVDYKRGKHISIDYKLSTLFLRLQLYNYSKKKVIIFCNEQTYIL